MAVNTVEDETFLESICVEKKSYSTRKNRMKSNVVRAIFFVFIYFHPFLPSFPRFDIFSSDILFPILFVK